MNPPLKKDGVEADHSRHPGQVMARLTEPAPETPTRLAVIADPHVAVRSTGTSKLYGRTMFHFEAAIDDIRGRGVDAVVSVGDLTKDGEPWNFEAVETAVSRLTVPFYSVPGNHDVPKSTDDHDSVSVDAFADLYAPDGVGYPFHTSVNGIDIIGLNTAGRQDRLFDTHDGAVTPGQLDWLAKTLQQAETPVVLMHHNLPGVHELYRSYRDTHAPEIAMVPTTRATEPLVETLVDGGRPPVLTGHYHIPATAVTDGIREVTAPGTCSFPQGYLLLDCRADGTTIRMVPLADSEGLVAAYLQRSNHSSAAAALSVMAAARLARFPLVNERC